jgi:hypothetical protein
MEALLLQIADEYTEKEERQMHLKELTEKKKRVSSPKILTLLTLG